jgi:VCBS repeat protein
MKQKPRQITLFTKLVIGTLMIGSAVTAYPAHAATTAHGNDGKPEPSSVQPTALPGVGSSITRTEILARAHRWVDLQVPYSQEQSAAVSDGNGTTYRPDCSGFVSMTWHLPKKSDGWDLNTGDFSSWSGKIYLNSFDELLPGDAVLSSGHMALFHRWLDPGHTRLEVYQERTWGEVAQHVTRNRSDYEGNGFRPIRYNNVTPSLNIADINHDDWQDIIGRVSNGDAYVYHGTGTDTFSAGVRIGSGWTIFVAVYLADIDHDGWSDIIGQLPDGDAFVYPATGPDTFGPGFKFGSGWNIFRTVSFADLDHDGWRDLIGQLFNGDTYVYHSTGAYAFGAGSRFGTGWNIFSAAEFADLNHDGRDDIVGQLWNGDAYVYHSTGTDTFAAGIKFGSSWNIFKAVMFADLDRDDWPDIVGQLTNGDAYVYHSTGTDTFGTGSRFGTGWNIFQ